MNDVKCSGDLVVLFVNQTATGKTLRKFSVKTDRGTAPFTAWEEVGSPLEGAEKGDYVEVEGHVQTNVYEKNGKNIYSTECVADKIICKKKAEVESHEPF